MASCEVETSPSLAVESVVNTDTSLAEHICAMSGSNRVKVGRAHSYSIVTHSQRDGIVASPPKGGSSHKNVTVNCKTALKLTD